MADDELSIEDFEVSTAPEQVDFGVDDNARKTARSLFERAGPAVDRQNFDYAIEMLLQAVKLDPENSQYRRMLRGCARKKFQGKKRPKSGGLGSMKIKTAAMRKNWKAVIEHCEDTLAKSPWHVGAQMALADALYNCGRLDDAVWAMQILIQDERDNVNALRQLGEYHEQRGDYNEAVACYGRIVRLKPTDEEAQDKVKDLSAVEVIDRAHLEDAESFQEFIRDKGEAQRLERDQRAVQSEERIRERINELEIDIEADPDNVNLYFDLATQLERVDDEDGAEEALRKAYEVSGKKFEVRMRLVDLTLRRKARQIAEARQALKADPQSAELKATLKKFRQELLAMEFEEFAARVEHYPAEPEYRYEYGRRLLQGRKYADAVSHLQQVRNDPRRKSDALRLLGQCFFHMGNLDLAVTHLEQSLESMAAGAEDQKKQLHYEILRVAEEAGDDALYAKHLNAVAAIDYGYRDVAERLSNMGRKKKEP